MDWSRGWLELADMVWPRRCGVCGDFLDTEERHVCTECLKDMPLTYFWSWRGNPAEQILWARTYLEGVVSLFYYSRDNDYKELLHKVKYGGDVALHIQCRMLSFRYRCTGVGNGGAATTRPR